MRALLVRSLLVCSLLGCGGGPQLTNLRCRDPARCQDVEAPLRVLLAVDFADETGTLDQGVLNFRLDGRTQQTVSLSDIFATQGLAKGSRRGTLKIDDDFFLDRMSQGQRVSVSLTAVNGAGHRSNEPNLTFSLHLGGQ